MNEPRVFLSATAYDLHQVRSNIARFVESTGFQIVASDDPRFFADPSRDTQDACLAEVATCDMLILIVGGRYGSESRQAGRSITNLEWATAYASGLPTFTFVEQSVWSSRRLWQQDRSRDLSPIVEDMRVFDFIEQVAGATRNNWIWPFSTSSDIVEVLRNQWSRWFAKLLRENSEAERIPVSADRQPVVGQYANLISKAMNQIDVLGVSLATIARSPRIETAIAASFRRGVALRVLILDPTSGEAVRRGAEEFGESNLITELQGMKALWARFLAGGEGVSLKTYSMRPPAFIFRIDSSLFVSHYYARRSGADSPTLHLSVEDSQVSDFYLELFEEVWDSAEPVQLP